MYLCILGQSILALDILEAVNELLNKRSKNGTFEIDILPPVTGAFTKARSSEGLILAVGVLRILLIYHQDHAGYSCAAWWLNLSGLLEILVAICVADDGDHSDT